MIKTLSRLVAPFFFAAAFTAPAAETSPDALVKQTVDEVLAAIQQTKDKRTLHELAEKKVLPKFDFREMTILALGRNWRKANEPQRQALVDGFRSLLVSTYTTALAESSRSDYTVEVRPVQMRPGDKDVTVRTAVKQSGRPPVAIDYRMALGPDGWKVYDVVVENLSLVTNYRSSFESEIGRSGIDGLIKTIEEKNRKLAES